MKNKILIALIFLLLGCSAFFLYLILNDNKTKDTKKTPEINQQAIKKETEPKTNLTEEQREKVINTVTKKATLKSVDIGRVVIILTEENNQEVSLSISEAASFVSQTEQEDGSIMNEEMALFDLPLEKEVQVQYDSANNELMLIMVEE